ncbi:hypothetical protein Tco_0917145 [Tanacetum coccineum]
MRVSTNAPPTSSNSSSNFEFQQMAAALEDKMTLTFRNEMTEMKNMMKAFVHSRSDQSGASNQSHALVLSGRNLDSDLNKPTVPLSTCKTLFLRTARVLIDVHRSQWGGAIDKDGLER